MKHAASVAMLALLAVLGSSTVSHAQTTQPPSGHWEGTIQVPGQPLDVQIDLKRGDDNWDGTISIPVQQLKAFPLSGITVKDNAVSFAMPGVPGSPQFSGTLSKDGQSLDGQFTQGGGTLAFALKRTGEPKIDPLPKSTPITKDLEGSWQGALDVNGTVLRLIFKLANGPSGGTGTVVSVDQNGVEIPITVIAQTGSHVKIIIQTIAGSFDADLKDGTLTGTWSQGPGTLPLTLKRQ